MAHLENVHYMNDFHFKSHAYHVFQRLGVWDANFHIFFCFFSRSSKLIIDTAVVHYYDSSAMILQEVNPKIKFYHGNIELWWYLLYLPWFLSNMCTRTSVMGVNVFRRVGLVVYHVFVTSRLILVTSRKCSLAHSLPSIVSLIVAHLNSPDTWLTKAVNVDQMAACSGRCLH